VASSERRGERAMNVEFDSGIRRKQMKEQIDSRALPAQEMQQLYLTGKMIGDRTLHILGAQCGGCQRDNGEDGNKST